MPQESSSSYDGLEQVRRRFDEFRSANRVRSRFPEALWIAAAELATRNGVNATARALGLSAPSLRKWVETSGGRRKSMSPTAKQGGSGVPAFLEFLAPATGAVTNCNVEVESPHGGKLRLELKAVATTELASLVRAFIGR